MQEEQVKEQSRELPDAVYVFSITTAKAAGSYIVDCVRVKAISPWNMRNVKRLFYVWPMVQQTIENVVDTPRKKGQKPANPKFAVMVRFGKSYSLAVCDASDTFDINTGIRLAMARITKAEAKL